MVVGGAMVVMVVMVVNKGGEKAELGEHKNKRFVFFFTIFPCRVKYEISK